MESQSWKDWALKHFRAYLYGHHCDVFTDHEALKSLLNTPQPSGNLARWGMTIQELDVKILHRSGKHNANADALSRAPLLDTDSAECAPFGVVAAMSLEEGLKELQRKDQRLAEIIEMLETGTLPEHKNTAKQLALTKSQYTLCCTEWDSPSDPPRRIQSEAVPRSSWRSVRSTLARR